MKKKDLKEDNSPTEQKGKKMLNYSQLSREISSIKLAELIEEYGEVYIITPKTLPFKITFAELS